MSIEGGRPYSFRIADLQKDRLRAGVEFTLQDFERWRDTHPEAIANHVNDLTDRLQQVSRSYSPLRRVGRVLVPGLRRGFESRRETEYIHFFGVHNLAAELDESSVDFFQQKIRKATEIGSSRATKRRLKNDYTDTLLEGLSSLFPEVEATTLVPWLKERVHRLNNILPEEVIQAGTMGNVLRVALGVIAIAAHDVMDEPLHVQKEHMQRVIPGAYVYGASYALIDEVMQSANGRSIPTEYKEKYHRSILQGLINGGDIDTSHLPDHPLTEELHSMYQLLRDHYPISLYPHLYHAAEAMYDAQHRDASLDPESVSRNGGIKSMYPDMAIKSAMTRVIADLLGRRYVSDGSISHFINENLGGQFRDDFEDHVPDSKLSTWTPFTIPYNPETESTNPLYDLFAYDAYIVDSISSQHPTTKAAYVRFSAGEIGCYLAYNPHHVPAILSTYPHTKEIARFIRTAAAISPRRADLIDPDDMRLLNRTMKAISRREQTGVDPRTFVSDRLSYINTIVSSAVPDDEPLSEAAHYALEAGGKRLRPALTLMLAEGLGVPREHIAPLLQTIELFHTSSLLFDDLPAQDNADLRRGRPTTHIQFNEWSAQLAGISMISRGFGALTDLNQHFPAERVDEVINYASSVLGLEGLCKGQAMDLLMEDQGLEINMENILEMYHYKTSLGIEASLVPLMLLLGRNKTEIDLMKRFAHHSGIVFQIRDDILDITATPGTLGKDTQNDINKANVARLCGMKEAQRLMEEHLTIAIEACQSLPFNTNLLQGTVKHFAERKK